MGSASAVDPSSPATGAAREPSPAGEPVTAHRKALDTDASIARRWWIDAFAWRICSLRPDTTWADANSLAITLWAELSGFDPRIAAELECESRDREPERGSCASDDG